MSLSCDSDINSDSERHINIYSEKNSNTCRTSNSVNSKSIQCALIHYLTPAPQYALNSRQSRQITLSQIYIFNVCYFAFTSNGFYLSLLILMLLFHFRCYFCPHTQLLIISKILMKYLPYNRLS